MEPQYIEWLICNLGLFCNRLITTLWSLTPEWVIRAYLLFTIIRANIKEGYSVLTKEKLTKLGIKLTSAAAQEFEQEAFEFRNKNKRLVIVVSIALFISLILIPQCQDGWVGQLLKVMLIGASLMAIWLEIQLSRLKSNLQFLASMRIT